MCKTTAAQPGRDDWIKKVDMAKFGEEMECLGKKLRKEEGKVDLDHLKMLVNVCDALLVVGLATLGMSPWTVVPWVCLGVAITIRWAGIAHHVSHGGYVRCDTTQYRRGNFALGGTIARCRDWLDWMLPEAWDVEHNTLHHYCTNEKDDPDFPQRNFEPVREMPGPSWRKWIVLPFGMMTWKWGYYAVNTWKHLLLQHNKRDNVKISKEATERAEHPLLIYQIFGKAEKELAKPWMMFWRVFAPYLFIRLIAPVVFFFYVGGYEAGTNAIINLCLAEAWANLHSFIVIVPNHAGEDMYYYDTHVKPNTATFYMRQIIASANYVTGSDPSYPAVINEFIDCSQGYLNYQIEHHCFPNMSMVSYRKAQPIVKEICARHGVPYTQEPIYIRVYKTLRIITGDDSMRLFPKELEVQADLGVSMAAH
eukprot:TRINITY_DN22999_c0_g1_i1.p1 TRINITY_DN22999_c0_g1~~TRINITY_DN22999_c0_g1_i1.p1  ORF type:complete len:422 (+),score=74.86 TRINITY_DN22999_c0_g1_i1:83-1348(+)